MFTIDELRKLPDREINLIGIGAVHLADGKDMFHFYSPKADKKVDDIHNHRSSFDSTVLKGTLRNYLYEIEEDRDSPLQVVKGACLRFCSADRKFCCPTVVTAPNVAVLTKSHFDTSEGNSYYLRYDMFHRVEMMTSSVITHVRFGPIQQTYPRFVRDTTNNLDCYLPNNTPESELWEIIETTLND